MPGEVLFQILPACSKIRCVHHKVLSYCFSKLICANWPASPSVPVSVTLFSVPFNPVVHQTVPVLCLRISSMTSLFLTLVGYLSCKVTHSVTSTWGGRQALRLPVNSNGVFWSPAAGFGFFHSMVSSHSTLHMPLQLGSWLSPIVNCIPS